MKYLLSLAFFSAALSFNVTGAVAQSGVISNAVAGYSFEEAAKERPFLQGFWPVMQLYLQIDRGIAAANLDTRASS